MYLLFYCSMYFSMYAFNEELYLCSVLDCSNLLQISIFVAVNVIVCHTVTIFLSEYLDSLLGSLSCF